MSIKTIDRDIQSGQEGVKKKINKGAEKLVFDILQASQYSQPIPSTVRELTTNACDSQREKEMALEILRGTKKAEDYYIQREGEAYADSNFDPSYYSKDYLNLDEHKVHLTYKQNEGTGFCDKFTVLDRGVGIGGRRLEGILELGYSTKRNTSENFGAFGLGAKVALSTGVDFYTITTVHNGKKFKCNCYNYKTDFIIPKFNLTTGKENPFITFSDGTKVYYEETYALNYTEISFGVKRHNRSRFRDAVEEQLLYIDNVVFEIEDEEGDIENVEFHADVLHNSKNLIISNSYVFSRPHILIVKDQNATTGINYGHINFRELEMEGLYGAVAFKCPMRQVMRDPDTGEEIVLQEGVDVTPSREKVIWNESTKNYVQQLIKEAALEATELVQNKLDEEDFVKWIYKCKNVMHYSRLDDDNNSDLVLKKLANIIDKDMLSPFFPGNKSIKFGTLQKVFGKKTDIKKITIERDWNTKKETVKRQDLESWEQFGYHNNKIYIKGIDTQFDWRKDSYVIKQLAVGDTLYVVTETDGTDVERVAAIGNISDDKERDRQMKFYQKDKKRIQDAMTALRTSEGMSYYEDIEVDEEWLAEYKKEAKQREEVAAMSHLSPEERRKIQERMVAYTLRECTKYRGSSTASPTGYIWDKVEPRTSDLMNTETRTYYGTKEDEESLILAADILNRQNPTHKDVWPNRSNNYDEQNDRPVYFWEYPPTRTYSGDEPSEGYFDKPNLEWDRPQLIRVNSKVAKHMATNPNCKHIDEFFYTATDTNHFSVDPTIVRWYTGYCMRLENDKFMGNMEAVNKEMYENYEQIQEYIASTTGFHTMENYLKKPQMKMFKKMIDFNAFLDTLNQDDPDAITAKARELFVFTDVTCNNVVDKDMIIAFEDLLLYLEPIALFLNSIDGIHHKINDANTGDEYSKQLNEYLRFKQRLGWKPPINLLTLNKNN
tara:strand:+ start:3203 stop:6037 length:2835 start_codon:yes stop_codon:yes gene_type:complete